MLMRIWTVRVHVDREADYLVYARTQSRPMFLAQDGCLGVFFLRREDGRHAACSLWRDEAAITALGRSELYQRIARGLLETGTLSGDPEVEVFAITGGALSEDIGQTLMATNRRINQ